MRIRDQSICQSKETTRKRGLTSGLLLLGALLAYPRSGNSMCEYGQLPGTMLPSSTAPFSLMWQPFDEHCQIKDELTRILGPPPWTFARSQDPDQQPYSFWASDARTPLISNSGHQVEKGWAAAPDWIQDGDDINLLYFGDSVDAHQIIDICREVEGRAGKVNIGGFGRNSPACHLPSGLKMVQEFVPGTWPTGPYLDNYWNEDAPQFNIPKGFQHLQQSTGTAAPDIVVYNALLWDLGRQFVNNVAEHAQVFLPPAFVQQYMTQLSTWMKLIEDSVPEETLLIFHNAAFPRLKDCRFGMDHAHPPVGQQMHVIQLNAASKQVVSNRTRWHLLDYGQMSEATMFDAAHLRDGLHPNSQFAAQTFNIILNLYREHKQELKRP